MFSPVWQERFILKSEIWRLSGHEVALENEEEKGLCVNFESILLSNSKVRKK